MRVKLVEQREGELLGPVDWSYDFDQHKWTGSSGGVNPESVDMSKSLLSEVEKGISSGETISVRCYSVFQEVIAIGMYDGWPHWKPTPSVLLHTWLGGEWQPFYSIREIKSTAAPKSTSHNTRQHGSESSGSSTQTAETKDS